MSYPTKWTDEKIEWLSNNYNKTYKEMTSHLDICAETIRLKIKELNLPRDSRYKAYKLDMSDEKFLADLDNPRLTAPDIVEKYKDKYGIGESRIHQLRKQRGIKLQINTIRRISQVERKVQDILDNLDLAYIREKRIGKYSIDFYLGFKLCIEVQGGYWHSRPHRIETDKRKKKYLNDLGYTILYLYEDYLDNAEQDIINYVKSWGFPI